MFLAEIVLIHTEVKRHSVQSLNDCKSMQRVRMPSFHADMQEQYSFCFQLAKSVGVLVLFVFTKCKSSWKPFRLKHV